MTPHNHDTHDPIAELRDELAAVSVSQSFAERVRERLADDLEPLRAELADLAVSPEFAVRVRQGVETSARPAWGFTRRWAIPATGLAAAAIAAVVLWPRQPLAPATAPVNTVADVEPAASPAVASSTPQVTPPPTSPVVTANRAVASERVEAGSSGPAKPLDPMLNVITDQPALIRAWMAQRATEPTPPVPESIVDIEIAPIEVSPVVVKWFIEPVPSGGLPIILRVTADMAERSAK